MPDNTGSLDTYKRRFNNFLHKHSDLVPDLINVHFDIFSCVWANAVPDRDEYIWFVAFTSTHGSQRFAIVEAWENIDDSGSFMSMVPMVPDYTWVPGDPLP